MSIPWIKVSDVELSDGRVSLARNPETGAYALTRQADVPDPYGTPYHVACPVADVKPEDLLRSLGESIELAARTEQVLREKLAEEERRTASAARVNT